MIIDSPIGDLRVFVENDHVVEVLLPGWRSDIEPSAPQDNEYAHKVEEALYKYFDCDSAKKSKVAHRELVEIALPDGANIDAPAFHKTVYKALLNDVPTGQTVTYGELAELAGNPGAARAVGTAMRKNPIPIIVPCHRVLQSGGGLGGYMGNGDDGQRMKKWLLRHEGVNLKNV